MQFAGVGCDAGRDRHPGGKDVLDHLDHGEFDSDVGVPAVVCCYVGGLGAPDVQSGVRSDECGAVAG
ncbi:hypothetical protein [Streptomyces sp. NPDC050485]|uniref:hypothetical protein n=1 Tax=Streptomyces sp. NPDC050485 TaxID=3365617 RepID=UPI0037BAEA0D